MPDSVSQIEFVIPRASTRPTRRSTGARNLTIALILCAVTLNCNSKIVESKPDVTKQWAEQVALGTEYGGSGAVVSRWTRPVRVSIMAGSATADLQECLSLIESLLTGSGITIRMASAGDVTAEMKVYFTELANFDAIARANSFQYVAGNWGYFYMFWDSLHALQKTFILLATDKLSGAQLRHFTFEEVTQSFGFANDSPIYPESIFYANGSDGGNANTLSALDRRLVKFLYSHVSPGSDKTAFDVAYEAHWNDQ